MADSIVPWSEAERVLHDADGLHYLDSGRLISILVAESRITAVTEFILGIKIIIALEVCHMERRHECDSMSQGLLIKSERNR